MDHSRLILELDTEFGSLNLSIIPLGEIPPHESTIPKLVESLVHDMSRTGFQRDPVIVDKNTHVALDGMHRRASLISLNAKYALCCESDYLDDSVRLERWLRYVIAPSRDLLDRLINTLRMKRCEDRSEAKRKVDNSESLIALLSSRSSFVSTTNLPSSRFDMIKIAYDCVRQFDIACNEYVVVPDFAPEESFDSLFSSESVFVLYPIPLTKQDVLETAQRGEILPFKTTRHILKLRPMGVYFPLESLRDRELNDCDRLLKEIMAKSTVNIKKTDAWYEGRRYSEPLAIFSREMT